MKPESKYKGSIKLSAIGDALGWITEFEKNQDSIKKKYGKNIIDSFYIWEKKVGGKFYGFIDKIQAGSYSDDTQLMLCVARSIEADGSVNQTYFAKEELANWLHYARGGGRTVKKAAEKISRKKVKWFDNFFEYKTGKTVTNYRESGANGAAMRVLPIALANLGNEQKILSQIFNNSIITHGHPRAHIGALLYGYAVNQIIIFTPEDFKDDNFIVQIGKDFIAKFALSRLFNKEIKDWIFEWNKDSAQCYEDIYSAILNETQNQLRMIYLSLKQNRAFEDVIKELGCYEIDTKGSGTATVLAGIYLACRFNKQPVEAIQKAVNLIGTDTDSIASFVGGLLGALYGQNIIPEKWKKVQDINYLDEIALDLLSISETRFIKKKTFSNLNVKNLNHFEKDDFNNYDVVYFSPLGNGEITFIDRQNTLTKGKYNLILGVEFDIGQSCIFSKIFDL